MSLLRLKNVGLAFGGAPLFEALDFGIERGERVCLIGRNGEGKSTLMKVMAGEVNPDTGERQLGQGVAMSAACRTGSVAWLLLPLYGVLNHGVDLALEGFEVSKGTVHRRKANIGDWVHLSQAFHDHLAHHTAGHL